MSRQVLWGPKHAKFATYGAIPEEDENDPNYDADLPSNGTQRETFAHGEVEIKEIKQPSRNGSLSKRDGSLSKRDNSYERYVMCFFVFE